MLGMFKHVSRVVGHLESAWLMLHAAIIKAAACSCGHKVASANHSSNSWTCWWTPEAGNAVKLKFYRAWLACRTPEAADNYREAKFWQKQEITLLSLPGKVYARVLERRVDTDCRTSYTGGSMQFSSLLWNTWPAQFSLWGFRGGIGICPTSCSTSKISY